MELRFPAAHVLIRRFRGLDCEIRFYNPSQLDTRNHCASRRAFPSFHPLNGRDTFGDQQHHGGRVCEQLLCGVPVCEHGAAGRGEAAGEHRGQEASYGGELHGVPANVLQLHFRAKPERQQPHAEGVGFEPGVIFFVYKFLMIL